jgi:hypothetical protein
MLQQPGRQLWSQQQRRLNQQQLPAQQQARSFDVQGAAATLRAKTSSTGAQVNMPPQQRACFLILVPQPALCHNLQEHTYTMHTANLQAPDLQLNRMYLCYPTCTPAPAAAELVAVRG